MVSGSGHATWLWLIRVAELCKVFCITLPPLLHAQKETLRLGLGSGLVVRVRIKVRFRVRVSGKG